MKPNKPICSYCKTDPGAKPGNPNVWFGFLDKEPWLGRLLQNIEPLPHNVYEYLKIELISIELFSEKATFLVFKTHKKLTHERWLPFSQIRKDNNGNLWITKWIYNRLKLKQENNCSPQETTMEIIK